MTTEKKDAAPEAAPKAQEANGKEAPDPLAELDALRKRNEILEAEKKAANNEAANYRKKYRSIEEDKQKAEADALKKKGEFEKLYEAEKKAKEELAQRVEKLSPYEQRFRDQADREVAALPQQIRDLLPDGLDDEAKMRWVEKAKAAAAATPSTPPPAPKPPTTAPTAPPVSNGATQSISDDELSRLGQELGYPGTTPERRKQIAERLRNSAQ